jgi:hypothetical protein
MQRWLITGWAVAGLALSGFAQVPGPPNEANEQIEPRAMETTPGEPVVPSPRFRVDEMHPVEGESPIQGSPARGPIDLALQSLIDLAQQDLTARLSQASDVGALGSTIDVLEARALVWPDRGLGCPMPGMVYIQVPVDGALIRLQAGGKTYEYHSGGSRLPFLCEQPDPALVPPVDTPSQPGETPLPPPGRSEGV